MSFFKGVSSVVAVMAMAGVVGCGGASKSSGNGDALTACTPAEAPAGSTVTCASGELENDCTLFVGNQPVAFTYDAEAGTVSFQVPAVLAGTKKITSQCGDAGARTIEPSFQVIAKSTDTVSAGDDAVVADNGDTILPSGGTPSSDLPSDVPSDAPSSFR